MKKLRTKFYCHYVDKSQEDQETVSLMAVASGSGENESFSKLTPAGNVSITITNLSYARGFFFEYIG